MSKSGPMELFSLKDQVALVTGATGGLGFAIAEGLGRAGAKIFLNGREEERCERVASQLCDQGLDVTPLAFAVGDERAMTGAMDKLAERSGRLDILVNNVGVRLRQPIDAIEYSEFQNVIDVNLNSAFFLARRAAGLMAPNLYGRIIMLSSISALRCRSGDAAYIAAKGGLLSLTRALASEYGAAGINVNAIAPGSFRTPPNMALLASDDPEHYPSVPLRRPGEPAEMVGPALFLASAASSYVTGHTLIVDGGRTSYL